MVLDREGVCPAAMCYNRAHAGRNLSTWPLPLRASPRGGRLCTCGRGVVLALCPVIGSSQLLRFFEAWRQWSWQARETPRKGLVVSHLSGVSLRLPARASVFPSGLGRSLCSRRRQSGRRAKSERTRRLRAARHCRTRQ